MPPQHHGKHHGPQCGCSAASTAASDRYLGRMPVYYPFPDFRKQKVQPGVCAVPPPAESTYLGDWYSTPAASECHPGTMAFPGPAGCTWARRPTQHVVHGALLLELGFNQTIPYDPQQLRQNEAVIEQAFGRHPTRCCEC